MPLTPPCTVPTRSRDREPNFKSDFYRLRLLGTFAKACPKTACLCVPHADRVGRCMPIASPNSGTPRAGHTVEEVTNWPLYEGELRDDDE